MREHDCMKAGCGNGRMIGSGYCLKHYCQANVTVLITGAFTAGMLLGLQRELTTLIGGALAVGTTIFTYKFGLKLDEVQETIIENKDNIVRNGESESKD